MRAFKQVDFGAPFGVKYCMPMFLEEFRSLPELIPSLQETGFFSSGFGGIVDYVLMPVSFGLLRLFPNRARNWIARLMEWGLKYTTRPPFGAVLRMEAHGQGRSLIMTVSHDDPYILTAAPAVACLRQVFDGTIRKPGLWRQATLVEPVRFFNDLATLGVNVCVTPPVSWAGYTVSTQSVGGAPSRSPV
jgi:saccharopine dehydrogenase (NAD+, L-lysine-forming)